MSHKAELNDSALQSSLIIPISLEPVFQIGQYKQPVRAKKTVQPIGAGNIYLLKAEYSIGYEYDLTGRRPTRHPSGTCHRR